MTLAFSSIGSCCLAHLYAATIVCQPSIKTNSLNFSQKLMEGDQTASTEMSKRSADPRENSSKTFLGFRNVRCCRKCNYPFVAVPKLFRKVENFCTAGTCFGLASVSNLRLFKRNYFTNLITGDVCLTEKVSLEQLLALAGQKSCLRGTNQSGLEPTSRDEYLKPGDGPLGWLYHKCVRPSDNNKHCRNYKIQNLN